MLRAIPVTRLTDLTPLDRLRLPVFSAVTPLARDLTTHFGKGRDAASAQASAVMEAIERASAEATPASTTTATLDEMRATGSSVIDPCEFDLPSDTAFAPGRRITWVAAYDLIQDEPVWIPRDLAINPPEEGVLREVDTNGLAAGNSLLEATLHGLCEVIERDAIGQLLFAALFGGDDNGTGTVRLVDPGTLPEAAAAIVTRVERAECELAIHDVTTEIGVPTFRCVISDVAFPVATGLAARRFLGYGTDPCSAVAVMRSITEAVQSRVGSVQGARDSFNLMPASRRRGATDVFLGAGGAGANVAMSDIPSFESDDLGADLEFVLDRLRRAGFERALVVDLTRPDWGVPVVRVRVPGLTSFLVNLRRPGWRCLRHLL